MSTSTDTVLMSTGIVIRDSRFEQTRTKGKRELIPIVDVLWCSYCNVHPLSARVSKHFRIAKIEWFNSIYTTVVCGEWMEMTDMRKQKIVMSFQSTWENKNMKEKTVFLFLLLLFLAVQAPSDSIRKHAHMCNGCSSVP